MQPTHAQPKPARTRGVLLVAALALFGIFAMHGWGTHGTTAHADGMPMVGVAAPTDSDQLAVEACHCADTAGAVHESKHTPGMLALCLAVLAGVLAMAVRLFLTRVTWAAVGRLACAQLPVPTQRDRDPPHLFTLCVIRC